MITAALTAAITFILHQFGVELSVAQIAGIGATIKVIIVVFTAIFGGRFLRKRLDAAKAASSGKAPADPQTSAVPPESGPTPPPSPKA